MICLPKAITSKFLQAVKEGRINPEDLSLMTSEERHMMLTHIVGEDAAGTVNALLESKLLLKNQEQGFITAIKEIGGLKPAIKNDMISKIQKLDKVLNPEEKSAFMKDLASSKLGVDVTYEEAQKISQLSRDVAETQSKIKPEMPDGSPERLAYGAKNVELQNYIGDLKNAMPSLKEQVKTLGKEFKSNPVGTVGSEVSKVAGMAKGIKASLDNSAIFRQGWKTLFTNPDIWAKNALESFNMIKRQLGKSAFDNEVIDGIKADIYSRQNAMNGAYSKMKLDIGNMEEAFPTSLPEKIPLFGRLYKASEVAYTGFLYRMRADIADKLLTIAETGGVDTADKVQLESIGNLVNSLTGRGNLGAGEKIGKQINTIFFSPKMLMSNVEFLTAHQLGFGPRATPFVQKQAAINLSKVIAGTALILGTAEALHPGSVETDPRSADFGKIRIGDTRFDVSAGMGSILTLAARIFSQSSKSSTTHKVTKLGTGKFGSQTGMDVAENFLENKLSPAGSLVKDLITQRDFQGNPITAQGEVNNLITPLPITNAQELLTNPKAANPFLGILADSLGIATNTYSLKKKKPQ